MRHTKTPRFQARHYDALAALIQHVRNDFLAHGPSVGIDRIEQELIILFRADNPKFSPDKFRAACQPRKEQS